MLKWGWHTLLTWELAPQTEFPCSLINTEMGLGSHDGEELRRLRSQDPSFCRWGSWRAGRVSEVMDKPTAGRWLRQVRTSIPWLRLRLGCEGSRVSVQGRRAHPNLAAGTADSELWAQGAVIHAVGRMVWGSCSRPDRGRKAGGREATRETLAQEEAHSWGGQWGMF